MKLKKSTKKAPRRKKRLDGWNLFGLVLGIVGVVGTIVTIIGYNAYLKDKKTIPTSGMLDAPKPAAKRILAIGSARLIVDSPDGVLLKEDDEPLISVHKFNDKLFVSAVMRNAEGKIVARLDENEWQLNRENYYDRNFTRKAIEVIGHSGEVVLQVVDYGDVVHFAGVFHRKDGSPFALIPVGEYGALMVTGSENHYVFLSSAYTYRHPDVAHPRYDDPKIPPIFEYPSDKHLGSSPNIDALTKLVRQSDNDDFYKGYRLGGSLDIGKKNLPRQ